MSGEVPYLSRFFVKFVEVIAAGVATAISAYLLAHFGGLLPPPAAPVSAPAPTAVQVGPTASESRRAQPTPPVAAAAVNEQRAVPQQDTDAPVAQPALKPVTDLPRRKRTKTDTSVSEKEPRQKSAEALARAALANVDANRPAPVDTLIGPGLTDTRSAPVDVQPRRVNEPPRQADVGPPQPVAVPPRAAGIEAAPHAADVRPQPVQPRADLPLEISAPQPPPTADQDKGVFSALKRMPDLLRPNPPAPTGETPRPPMPVGTASPEIREFGN